MIMKQTTCRIADRLAYGVRQMNNTVFQQRSVTNSWRDIFSDNSAEEVEPVQDNANEVEQQ